jgi:hypothetical protein
VSFQAYLDTVKKVTGKSPELFRELALMASLLLTACATVSTYRHIDLKTVPKALLDSDMGLLRSLWEPTYVATLYVAPSELARHPDALDVFTSLGYVRRQGTHLAFTAKGIAASIELGLGYRPLDRGFPIERGPLVSAPHFTDETEWEGGGEADVGIERTYLYDRRIGALTYLGAALARRGLLYSDDFHRATRWKGPKQPLHEWFNFYPGHAVTPAGANANFGIGGLGFAWSRACCWAEGGAMHDPRDEPYWYFREWEEPRIVGSPSPH